MYTDWDIYRPPFAMQYQNEDVRHKLTNPTQYINMHLSKLFYYAKVLCWGKIYIYSSSNNEINTLFSPIFFCAAHGNVIPGKNEQNIWPSTILGYPKTIPLYAGESAIHFWYFNTNSSTYF